MSTTTKKCLRGIVGALMAVISLESVYLLGYRNGGKDALNCDFSAEIGDKVVRLGNGTNLFRSRPVARARVRGINSIPTILIAPKPEA